MPPLKVGFYVFFPAGGIGRYTHELVGAINALPDVSAEVLCTPDFQWKDAVEYPTWTGLKSISHSISVVRRFRFLHRQFVNPVRAIRHAVKTGTDILHFSNVNHLSFPYWRGFLQASGVRVAISVHDVKRQKCIINRRWEDRQLKALYRFADALFVHSMHQANELIEFAGVREDQIHIVPHGPYPHGGVSAGREEARRQLGMPADEQIALFFGQIRDEKNLDQLIEALQLSTSKPHLVVTGRGSGKHRDVEFYRQRAEHMGVRHLITFMDRFIPDEEVPLLFAAADWVALPYSEAFSSQSGVLNVAVHYEKPVLVSSSPVLRETVTTCDIGVVCAGDTAAEIAAGIDRMSQRMEAGYPHQFDDYRHRFSWQENVRRTLDVYAELAAKKRPKQVA